LRFSLLFLEIAINLSILMICFERFPEIGAMLDPPTAFTTRAELMEADDTLKDKEFFNNTVCAKFT
jgi:hypothetical protein